MGQDDEFKSIYKYIVWHAPDLSIMKIYDGVKPDGFTINRNSQQPLELQGIIIISVV